MKFKVIMGIMLTLLLISVLTSSFNVIPAKAPPSDPPIHIHLTWQDETNTTMTITWQTSTNTAGDTVLYDTVSRNGVPASYSYSASGSNYTYDGASGYIHNTQLTGLTPDTVYYFICGGDTGGWSNERAFRTAPSVSSDVRFVVGADMVHGVNWTEVTKISKAMAKFNPAFVMHGGDKVEDGTIQDLWDLWFTHVHDHWIGENNLTIPIISVLGNHENPIFSTCKYFVQFALPGNEMWYSYNWGPDIHIICLDSEFWNGTENSASGEQLHWLENDLAAHANYRWKFVIFHKPPFVCENPWTPALTYWVPLFDKYHVDIVFTGHEHNYERSYPLNWTASQTEPQDYSNGTLYIVTGGWGGALDNTKPIWYMTYQSKIYHFCLVDISKNGVLRLQAKDNQGNTFDEVTIYKPRRVPKDYQTIQDAINAATPEDTVLVSSGIYYEHVTIDKSLSLVGEDRSTTILDGGGTGIVVYITVDDVTVSGFTIQNGGLSDANVYLEFSNHSRIISNVFTRDELYGDYGVKLNSSFFNTISGNNVTRKSRGICLNGSLYNTISGNNITNNDYGIYFEYSLNNSIYGNYIAGNNHGVHVLTASNNSIYHNSFVDNTEQVYSSESTNIWDNGREEGNYWSNYNGVDSDGDGIGDEYLPWEGVDYYPLMNPYIPADANHDGYVNVIDLGLLSDAWLTGSEETNYNPHVDLNMDGFCNVLDLGIMSDNWLKSSI